MASQPTGISAPAFAAPSLGRIKPTMLRKNACQEHTTDNVAAPASYVEVGGAELMAAPVMGGGAPAEASAPTENQRDEAEGGGDHFVRGGQERAPTKERNSHVRTVVKADTPTSVVTKGNEQYSAPWVVESPGGTATTSAYNDGKKRCLSAEEVSGTEEEGF
jgi:hypothetical protein